MSTRAMIGMKMSDGTVKAIYLQNDGYTLHAGYMLATFYGSGEKVRDLLALGDLSTIGINLTTDTIAYHRDRGEILRSDRQYASPEAYLRQSLLDSTIDYAYLFDDGRWLYASQSTGEFIEIKFTTGELEDEK